MCANRLLRWGRKTGSGILYSWCSFDPTIDAHPGVPRNRESTPEKIFGGLAGEWVDVLPGFWGMKLCFIPVCFCISCFSHSFFLLVFITFVFGNVDSKKIITSCSHTDLLWWTSMLNIYLYRTCDFGDGLLLDFVTTLFGIHWNNIIALQVQLSIQSSCDTVLTTSPCHFPWEIPLSDDQPLSIGAPFGTPHLAFEIDTCQHRAAHEIDQQSLETWQLLTRAKRAIHQGKMGGTTCINGLV